MSSSSFGEIHRGRLVNVVLGLLGKPYRSIRLTQNGVDLIARTSRGIPFAEMAGPPRSERTVWGRAIAIPLRGGSVLRATGFRRGACEQFIAAATQSWRQFVRTEFNAAGAELEILAQVVERLETPRRYPAACLLQPFVERAQLLVDRLPVPLPADTISPDQHRMYRAVAHFAQSPAPLRDAAIARFVERELEEMQAFFDDIETHPLTPEQRHAVITDEDATLVLAGAGSGKTSVIVAKAAYLMDRGIRAADEILLLAFGRSAAAEMAARIKQKCGAAVDARTFHALGLDIIRAAEGQGPALAPHAHDERRFRALLRDILLNDLLTQESAREHLLRWFAEFFQPYKSEWDFESDAEYRKYVSTHELRTLQGEVVRSFEELKIANWLFINGIAYVYEPLYEHALPHNDRRAYMPDFRLTESGVYIEHFGVRKERGPDGTMHLTTAPHIDRIGYLEGMAWKRDVHKQHGTTLIETFSYENVDGHLLESLENKLAPYATPKPIPTAAILNRLSDMGQVDAFTQTIGMFLRHFKSGGLTINDCRQRALRSVVVERELAFLAIFEPFLAAYEARLGDRIDFEDMIARATDHIREGRYRSPYRHILVDEFQDISDGRAQMLLALKAQHADARIFAVGDDWQSIYRFAGSDIHLMRHFGQAFGGAFVDDIAVHSTVDLGRTFRSIDRIAHAARRFVLRNPSQIKKQVIPAGTSDGPAISVRYHPGHLELDALRSTLAGIAMSMSDADGASVLLLGRYQFVEPDNLAEMRAAFPQLAIHFMTVHRSKGLEADHVIILRAASGRLGFPSEIVDDSLLDMVLPEAEPFEHAEERRLFYVALTRARRSVTILADRDAPSVFVQELVADAHYGVLELTDEG